MARTDHGTPRRRTVRHARGGVARQDIGVTGFRHQYRDEITAPAYKLITRRAARRVARQTVSAEYATR